MAGVAWGMGRGEGSGDGEMRTVGMAVVAGVHGAGHASIAVGQGTGDVFLHGQPSRSASRGHGNGGATIPVDGLSGGGYTDDINRSGYATGGARYGGISRGPEVPLPIPTPKKGNANDVTNVWCHGKSLEGNAWSCSYCGTVKLGGGATRFKQHLAGLGPECYSCVSAPHHVVDVFRKGIPDGIDRRRKAKEGKKRVVDEVNHLNNLGASIHIDCEDEHFDILGLHPWKEVVYLTTIFEVVGYHLKTSKVQFLGNSRPSPKTYYYGHSNGIYEAFVYTPCMAAELIEGNIDQPSS